MKDKITVKLTLSKAAWKALRMKYRDDGRAIEASGWELTLLTTMLERRHRVYPRLEKQKISNAETYAVYIPLYVFYRCGGYINLNKAVRLNQIIREREIDFICEGAALLRASTGLSREVCLASILDKKGYTEDDFRLETVKKRYYRKYIDKEREYRTEIEYIKDINK